jgi:hypothetical protein
MKLFLFTLLAAFLYGCGFQEDMRATKDKHHDEDYQRGYDWAKNHGITDEGQCARFLTLATESSSLQGCLDYYYEYKRKAKEFSGNYNDDNEPIEAPSAPQIEEAQSEEGCESINQFC